MTDRKHSLLYRSRIGFALLAIAALVWAVAGWFAASHVSTALDEVDEATGLLRNHLEADMQHDAIRGDVLGLLASRQNPAISAGEMARSLAERSKDFRQRVAQTAAFGGDEAVNSAAKAVTGDIDAYLAAARAIAAEATAGRDPEPAQMRTFQKTFADLEDGMANISDKVETYVETARGKAATASRIGMGVAIACLLMIGLVLRGVWARLSKEIIAPVVAVSGALQQMSQGQLTAHTPHSDKLDEIGSLARAADELRSKLLATEDARQEQEAAIVRSLGAALARLAQGDLAVKVEQDLGGAFACLRDDFNRATAELGRTLRLVNEATGETLNTAKEISQSVNDLSNRNEQQAASLQTIASAISGVTGRVAAAAQSVSSAQAAVRDVNDEVAQGGSVILSAVAAMDRIESSSLEIGQIIAVIDGIAFQTNLLALNAGVEAARAGEAGKGFAVVATEVRALAQRSADAASQIKELVTASSGEVEQGVRLVREAGTSLQAIMGGMGAIAEVMEQVNSGTHEQSNALSEIDRSARSLEVITQTNAALAEQVSAATRQVYESTQGVTQHLQTFSFGAAASSGPNVVLRARAA